MPNRAFSVAVVATLSSIYASHATPYASGVTESAGVVSFRLNEAADNVTIVRDGVSTPLGALPSGVNTFSRNGAANYRIVVSKTGAAGYNTFALSSSWRRGSFADKGILIQGGPERSAF